MFAKFILLPALAIRTLYATFGSVALVLPLGLLLVSKVGLPLLLVMLVLGAPLLILLAVLGLPLILVLAVAFVAVMTLPALVLVMGLVLKLFLFVVLPVWLLVKAIRWVLKPRDGGTATPPPATATGDL